MNKIITNISRATVYFMGLSVFIVCALLLPEIAREEVVENVENTKLVFPFLIGAWILATPVLIALYQTLKLIKYIERNEAFSSKSVQVLQNIKTCTFIFNILVVLGAVIVLPYGRSVGEDMTAFITLGFIVTFVSSTVAVFISVLQKLLQDAILIKSENDQII